MEVEADADAEQVGGWSRSDWREGTSEETRDKLLRDWEGWRGRSLRSEQRSCLVKRSAGAVKDGNTWVAGMTSRVVDSGLNGLELPKTTLMMLELD